MLQTIISEYVLARVIKALESVGVKFAIDLTPIETHTDIIISLGETVKLIARVSEVKTEAVSHIISGILTSRPLAERAPAHLSFDMDQPTGTKRRIRMYTLVVPNNSIYCKCQITQNMFNMSDRQIPDISDMTMASDANTDIEVPAVAVTATDSSVFDQLEHEVAKE